MVPEWTPWVAFFIGLAMFIVLVLQLRQQHAAPMVEVGPMTKTPQDDQPQQPTSPREAPVVQAREVDNWGGLIARNIRDSNISIGPKPLGLDETQRAPAVRPLSAYAGTPITIHQLNGAGATAGMAQALAEMLMESRWIVGDGRLP